MTDDTKIYTTWKIPGRYEAVFESADDAGMSHKNLTALAALLGAAVDDDGENDIAPLAAAPTPAAPVAHPVSTPAPKAKAPSWDSVLANLKQAN